MMPQKSICPNLNHSRTDAPVRYCPMCGKVVNKYRPIKTCTQEEHAKSLRKRTRYCMHCGDQLIK